MLSFLNAKIWLYLQPIDFRKQRDGLIVEVAANLKKDPASGQWFIFRNKQGNKIKIILWERNGSKKDGSSSPETEMKPTNLNNYNVLNFGQSQNDLPTYLMDNKPCSSLKHCKPRPSPHTRRGDSG
jgi:hypothetical protein